MASPERSIPTEQDLAYYVPAHGFHGMELIIPGHGRFWRRQLQTAVDRVEPAREDIARKLWHWLTLDGKVTQDVERIFRQTRTDELTGDTVEGWRRTMLGALAMSIMLRSGVPVDLDQPILDGRGMDPDDTTYYYDISINRQHPEEWPYEPRLHVAIRDEAIPTYADTPSEWFIEGRLAVNLRYPAELTPVAVAEMAGRGQRLDPQRAITLLPFITAQHATL